MKFAFQRSDIGALFRSSSRAPFPLLIFYPAAWAGFYTLSSEFWFLPAGLRVAMLWLTPRHSWGWLALAEWIGIAAVQWVTGTLDTPTAKLLGIFLPWLIYAAATNEVLRFLNTGDESEPRRLSLLIVSALGGAACNAFLLTGLTWLERHEMPNAVTTWLVFALGDFAGAIVLAPLTVLIVERQGMSLRLRRVLDGGLVLLPVAGILLSVAPWVGFPPDFAWSLVAIPLLIVGAARGRVPAIMAITGVACGFVWLSLIEARTWPALEVQRVLAVAGGAALLLGARRDAMLVQRQRLSASIQELQLKSDALRDVAIRLSSHSEVARRRLGLELHDQVGQDMTALATRLHLVQRAATDSALREELNGLQQMVLTAQDHLQGVIRQLHPIALERFGLVKALAHGPLAQIAEDAGVTFDCEIEGPVEILTLDVATAIYRICQEAVTNGVKHGCGQQMRIRLLVAERERSAHVELLISDEAGIIELPPGGTGLGLQGIRDRAHALGATYRFNAPHGAPRHWLHLPNAPITRPAVASTEASARATRNLSPSDDAERLARFGRPRLGDGQN